MEKTLLFYCIVLLTIFAGCSLTPEGTQSGASGLRLLQGTNGTTTTLSDPDYDDWSPHLIDYRGTTYLYFLSKRPFTGTFMSNTGAEMEPHTGTKPGGVTGVFLATQDKDSPTIFTNLQLYFIDTIDEIRTINVFSNGYFSGGSIKVMATVVESGGATNIACYDDYEGLSKSSLSLNDTLCGGTISANGQEYIFLGSREERTQALNTIPGIDEISIPFLATSYYPYVTSSNHNIQTSDKQEGEAILQFEPGNLDAQILLTLSTEPEGQKIVNNLLYSPKVKIQGVCPALFQHPQISGSRFGFYLSINGMLSMMVYTDYYTYPTFSSDQSNSLGGIVNDMSRLQKQPVFPLLSVTHYPGTTDQDPHLAAGQGLFFASDRNSSGVKNLYFVPEKYLTLPDMIFDYIAPYNPGR